MIINRVQAEFIGTNRIDPDYYRPEHLADEKCLRKFGSDELTTVGHFFAGPFGSKLPSDLYLSSGIPLFRVGNVGSMEVLLNGMAHLAPEVHEELSDSEVIPGDLLIVKASVGEKICRVPQWMPRANITQHIIGIRPNGHADMDYVAAFLFCQYGRRQLVRRSLGSIIQYLGITDSRSVLLPRIKSTAQKYLGDKVRQADRLKMYARQVEREINHTLDAVVPVYDQTPKMWSHVSSALLGDRFDNQPYRTHFLSLIRSILGIEHDRVSSVAELIGGAPVPSELFGSKGVPLVRIRDITPQGFSQPEAFVPPIYVAENSYASAQAGWIVVGMDGEFRAQYFLKEELPQFVNQRVAIIQAHSMRPELLTFWLNRAEGQMQLNRWTTQTTVGHIRLDDIRTLLVPRLEKAVENKIADTLLMARRADWYAQAMTLAAKLLIEALIEGKLMEEDFIGAQEALERGDHSADRALLSRLVQQGFDVPGLPLFPDFDVLYALLAAQTETATD